jgi:hypothetical protein
MNIISPSALYKDGCGNKGDIKAKMIYKVADMLLIPD